MAEIKSKKAETAKRDAKKALTPVVLNRLDNTAEDVLKYVKEGREIYFADFNSDNEAVFLELSDEVVRELPHAAKDRYVMARNIVLGRDVIGDIQNGVRGWEKDYNIRPGSATANLEVFGKKEDMDYYWVTPAKLNAKKAQGWQVDTDLSTHTIHKESCSYKTVGGEKAPELILMKRSKKASAEHKAKQKAKTDRIIKHNKAAFKESVERIGAEAHVE